MDAEQEYTTGRPRFLLTTTRSYRRRSADQMVMLVELMRRGPGESGELSRRTGWDRSRVEGCCRDLSGDVRKGSYGFELTREGRDAARMEGS